MRKLEHNGFLSEIIKWCHHEKMHSSKYPIVFDVNYKPYSTNLLRQAEDNGCQVIRGSEMLWEQGVVQFELWTERTAPYGVMKGVVLRNCLPQDVLQ
jgi:shikimate 5-dehydrogenase